MLSQAAFQIGKCSDEPVYARMSKKHGTAAGFSHSTETMLSVVTRERSADLRVRSRGWGMAGERTEDLFHVSNGPCSMPQQYLLEISRAPGSPGPPA